ncbi:MAG: glycosyltransferase [Oscillospiraceae bacterium]|nr:glycosyltransferase [Oscillospiraceae bacterium]
MHQIRVLHILPGLGAAGCETFARNLCLSSPEDIRHEIAISTLPGQFYEPELRAAGIAIHRTAEFTGMTSLPRHLRALHQLLKKAKRAGKPFDIVHGHMDYLNALNLFAAKLAGVKIRVCHSHIAGSQAQKPSFAARAYRWAMRLGIRLFATDYFACSPEAAASMFPWRKAGAVRIIPNGIDLARFAAARNDPALPERKRAELGISPERRILITVARLTAQKNPLFLLDVIAEAAKMRPPPLLLWCGTGDAETVRRKIAALGLEDHVRLLGNRRDVSELLPLAECFLLPSRWEGFGIALIEAQAAGVPCLASTHVPRSTDMGACRYLPLSVSAWAETVRAGLANGFPGEIDQTRLARYDTRSTGNEIADIYRKIFIEKIMNFS